MFRQLIRRSHKHCARLHVDSKTDAEILDQYDKFGSKLKVFASLFTEEGRAVLNDIRGNLVYNKSLINALGSLLLELFKQHGTNQTLIISSLHEAANSIIREIQI